MAGTLTPAELAEIRFALEHPPLRRRRERDTSWHKAALCADLGPRPFYQEPAEGRALCATCEVRVDCAVAAVEMREPAGVWAGMTPAELNVVRALLGRPPVRAIPDLLPPPGPELEEPEPDPWTARSDLEVIDAYREATTAAEAAQAALLIASGQRKAAVLELSARGWGTKRIAAAAGVGRDRIREILGTRRAG